MITKEWLQSISIEDLRAEIKHHNDLYWNHQKPEISDQEYDLLINRLAELSPDDELLAELPEKITGEAIKHEVPMLSMDKKYNRDDIFKWAAKTGDEQFVISTKMDVGKGFPRFI